jgi:uncharacterized protein (DUF302 family)
MHAKPDPRTKGDTPTTRPLPNVDYARSVRLAATDAAVALAQTRSAFGREGFGVIAEIDFRDALQRSLDKDVGPYWLLEICNPNLADRALAADRKAGLLMPCKVAVWQEGRDAVVAALRPEVAVGVTGADSLAALAREAERHIERALVHLQAPERELAITD